MPDKQNAWQEALADLITDPKELLTLLDLDHGLLAAAKAATNIFPLKVSRGFVARMQKKNVDDPLLKQVLPLGIELTKNPHYQSDPLQENAVNPVPGLLHKYASRVLVTLTSACAVHCRYCFRREFPYADNNPGKLGWEKIFSYISNDTKINEVILSGGDPLAVSDKLLKQFSDQLSAIPHVTCLRIHTRMPVVLPERITTEFLNWAKALQQKLVIIIHANHANEIDDAVKNKLLALREVGVTMLNQSVLLKGVNDDAAVLTKLSHTLFDAGVLPYYLHMLDKVQGAAHFDLSEDRAIELHRALTQALPGYLVPRLVREEPGEGSKTIL